MRITLNPNVSRIGDINSFQDKQISNKQNVTQVSLQNNPQQVAFKGWWNDMTFYFAKKLGEQREGKKREQFKKVEKTIHDDVRFMAERQGISLEAAKQRYEDNLKLISLPLNYRGEEQGLNQVIGYSLEKYKVLMELLLPLMLAKNGTYKEYPVPNGVLLFGPGYTGKTHFAEAIGEHISLKHIAEFDAYNPEYDAKGNNPVQFLEYFEKAEKTYLETGKRQVLFFDNLDILLDEENPDIRDIFLAKTKDCSKNGITWIGTCNTPDSLPDIIFKPSRLNVDVFINKMSEGEKSAVMSYFWKQRQRVDESNHDEILDKNKVSGFHFYPPEVKDVAKAVSSKLYDKDRESDWHRRIIVRAPVTTDIVNEEINRYLGLKRRDDLEREAVVTIQATSQNDYVKGRRAKYADKK